MTGMPLISANILIACVALFSAHSARAEAITRSTEKPPLEAQAAAEQGINAFKAIIIKLFEGNGNNRRFLDEFGLRGIETPTDVHKLQLGSPLPTYRISLKTLRTLRSWSDLGTVLPEKINRFVYPIKTEEEVRSSLSVALSRTGKNWLVTDWSNGKLVNLVAEVQRRYPNAKSILWFPGLNRYFLVDETDFTIIIALNLIDQFLPAPTAGISLDELQKLAAEVVAERAETQLPKGQPGPDRLVR